MHSEIRADDSDDVAGGLDLFGKLHRVGRHGAPADCRFHTPPMLPANTRKVAKRAGVVSEVDFRLIRLRSDENTARCSFT